MREVVKNMVIWIFVCIISVVSVISVDARTLLDDKTTEAYLNSISSKLMSTYTNPAYGSAGGEWTVMGLARDGSVSKKYLEKYKENLSSFIKKCNGIISENKYTEYSRVVLALTAIGEDATYFCGYNLVEPLCDVEKVKIQGINGISYALIALESGGYSSTDGSPEEKARDKYISEILNAELTNGGWSLSGDKADADITAVCIQALTPYIETNKNVKKAVDSAINILSNIQCESGGFATQGVENCESIAQVLVAISGIGISVDDERFVKNENTILDALLTYYKNSGFSHIAGKSKNAIATDQGMCALVAYYRNLKNKNALYDMSDGLVYRAIGVGIEETTELEESTNTEQNETTVEETKKGNSNKYNTSVQSISKNTSVDKEVAATNEKGEEQKKVAENEVSSNSEQITKKSKKKSIKTESQEQKREELDSEKKQKKKSAEATDEEDKKVESDEIQREEIKKAEMSENKNIEHEKKEISGIRDIEDEEIDSLTSKESENAKLENNTSETSEITESKLWEVEDSPTISEKSMEQENEQSKHLEENVTETIGQTSEFEKNNLFIKIIILTVIILGAGVLDKVIFKFKGKRKFK